MRISVFVLFASYFFLFLSLTLLSCFNFELSERHSSNANVFDWSYL